MLLSRLDFSRRGRLARSHLFPLSPTRKRAILQLPNFQYVAHSALTLALPERSATPSLSIVCALSCKNTGVASRAFSISSSFTLTEHPMKDAHPEEPQ